MDIGFSASVRDAVVTFLSRDEPNCLALNFNFSRKEKKKVSFLKESLAQSISFNTTILVK